jgi:uncharacterized Zn ribbon protein
MTDEYPLLLNCTACRAFREYEREQENVVRCYVCGKRHSDNSLQVADPDTTYARDEAGNLLEVPP